MNPTKAQLDTVSRFKAAGYRELECTSKGIVLVRARGDVTTAVRVQKNGKAVREVVVNA